MSATVKSLGWRRLLAAAAGAVAAHQSGPGVHAVADGGVIHSDGIQGTG